MSVQNFAEGLESAQRSVEILLWDNSVSKNWHEDWHNGSPDVGLSVGNPLLYLGSLELVGSVKSVSSEVLGDG